MGKFQNMARYIEFTTDSENGETILVEVDKEEVSPPQGLVKAGIKEKLRDTVGIAQKTFSEAVKTAIKANVQTFIEAVNALPDPPTEVEITFGLKATGEAGNVAIGKTTGEVNYTVKLAWKQLPKDKT
ncbi:MAG TPA: hypothetical protein DD379_12200 [Cyanobacteria bacterium UBA11162]|nr:hypothetical protein [Cyanobacteria bacterium UBA11162]